MKIFTIEDMKKWDPCYDPSKWLSPEWKGDILDILDMKHIPFHDRIWVLNQGSLVPDRLLRMFAVECIQPIEHFILSNDSFEALLLLKTLLKQEESLFERFPHVAPVFEYIRDRATQAAWKDSFQGNGPRHAAWAIAWACSPLPAKASSWAAAAIPESKRTQAIIIQEMKLRSLIKEAIDRGDDL